MSTAFMPGGGDFLKPETSEQPGTQSFEQQGIPEMFSKAVAEELTKDEKIVWLGQPSRNQAIYPDNKKMLLVIGSVLVGLAVVLAFVSWIITIAFGLFGGLFFGFYSLIRTGKISSVSGYKACYAITNRRVLLFETGLTGVDPGTFNFNFTGARCKSWLPHQLLGLEARKHPTVAGAGEVIFEYIFVTNKAASSYPGMTGTVQVGDAVRVPRGFYYLDNMREVENLIRKTLLVNLEKAMDSPGVPAPAKNAAAIPTAVEIVVEDCREDGEISAALKEKIVEELSENERLVWLAQPVPALVFRRNLGYFGGGAILALVAFVWLASMLFTGSAQKHEIPVVGGKKGAVVQVKTPPHATPFNPLPLILLIPAVGLTVVPVLRWKLSKGTIYGLSNRRALVYKEGLFGPSRESYSPLEVSQMRRADSWLFADAGDVIFRSVTVITTSRSSSGKSHTSTNTTHYGFLAIAHVKEVEKLVRETLIDRFVDKLQAANAF
jgi:hypothetical protein